MKLNLGCGKDVREGYTNVDFLDIPGATKVDLSKFPWPFADKSADEIMMLDFLEHFPCSQTANILQECWRVLKTGGKLIVQVPDLEHCARAASFIAPFMCNNCGWEFPENDVRANFFVCNDCGRSWHLIAQDAVQRLYGGQDVVGNWHFTAFSSLLLIRTLERYGFESINTIEKLDNGQTHWQNWNIRVECVKYDDIWRD